jgi:hypothetical protein
MNHGKIIVRLVTKVAEIFPLCLQLEISIHRFRGVLWVSAGMANHALAYAHRTMDKLRFPHA